VQLTVVRAGERFRTSGPGRDTWHAFSFGEHYDPARTGLGPLLACNEDRLAPGAGYDPHEHRDIEIVTWVLDGVLLHDDGLGHRAQVGPGSVQVLSAGTGVTHAEHAGADGPAHLVQMWLLADAVGEAPAYASADVSRALAGGGWVPLAGGRVEDRPAVGIRQRAALLRAARLDAGASLPLGPAPFAYVHVARGQATVAGTTAMAPGDAALLTDVEDQSVEALAAVEVLVWQLQRPAWEPR
jgi:redox-sensitive bicupin YhaK (pirin superfamily)